MNPEGMTLAQALIYEVLMSGVKHRVSPGRLEKPFSGLYLFPEVNSHFVGVYVTDKGEIHTFNKRILSYEDSTLDEAKQYVANYFSSAT